MSALNRLNPASLSALTRQTKIKRVIMANLGGLIHVFIITIRVKIQQEVRRAYLVCDLLVFWFVEMCIGRQCHECGG